MIQRLCVPFPTHLLTIRSAFSKFSYPTIVMFLAIVVVFLALVVASVLAFEISLILCLRRGASNYARLGRT